MNRQRAVLLICLVHITHVAQEPCPESRKTATVTESCPQNKDEWKQRSDAKRCSLVKQKCTGEFVYHCVINSFANETLEVCSPKIQVIGHRCVEYNSRGAIVQESPYLKCDNSCPFSYTSIDAYKYQECYRQILKRKATGKNEGGTVNDNPSTIPSVNWKGNTSVSGCVQECNENIAREGWKIAAAVLIIMNIALSIPMVWIVILVHRGKLNIRQRKDIHQKNEGGEDEIMLCQKESNKDKKFDDTNSGNPNNEYEKEKDDDNKDMKRTGIKKENDESNEQKKSRNKKAVCVVAVDIGDNTLNMALSCPESSENIGTFRSEKLCILLDTNGKTTAFGNEAFEKYSKEYEDLKNYKFINCDELSKEVISNKEPKLTEYNEVMSSLFETIKTEIRNKFSNANYPTIHYIFVIPSYWGKKPKKTLKKEILKHLETEPCVIRRKHTLSPFIHGLNARLLCINFNVDDLVARRRTKPPSYAVLHIGLSYCDLTFLSMGKDDCEVPPISPCHPWSIRPEDIFLLFLEERYNVPPKTNLERHQYVTILSEFEKLKRSMMGCSNNETSFEFKLPGTFIRNKDKNEESIDEKNSTIKVISTEANTWTLEIKYELLKTCFKEMKDTVAKLIEDQQGTLRDKNVICVVMTGEYSNMQMMWEEAEINWFKDFKVKIATTTDTHAFAKGGVFFGQKRYG